MTYTYQAHDPGWLLLKDGKPIGQIAEVTEAQIGAIVALLNGTEPSPFGYLLGLPINPDLHLDACEDCGTGEGVQRYDCCDRMLCKQCHGDPGVDDEQRAYGTRYIPCADLENPCEP